MAEIHDGASLRAALADIASNFSFSWVPGARALFAELAPERFAAARTQPTALLSELTDDDLDSALTPEYASASAGWRSGSRSCGSAGRGGEERELPEDFLVAYFSAEFGLHEWLPVYSGGLGVLAGDHLKSASDLGLPLVGIGLLYRRATSASGSTRRLAERALPATTRSGCR